MKTVTVRDLRQRWPETERALQVEHEIVITRDAKPVARLLRYVEPQHERQRFDPEAQARWQRKASRGKVVRLVEKYLLADRAEPRAAREEA
jgi:antitoxin (DNA-binding transcriptional repressor) of toxin-antitoxin stability system